MKNILSRNQLDEWHHSNTVDSYEHQREDDYYECMIDCQDNQSQSKRICREILM